MWVLYSLALTVVLVAGSPWWLFRMATSGKYREGLPERLGRVPRRLRAAPRAEPVVWVHAVSVGEVLAAGRMIAELGERLPGWRIVVSTTTRTGQRLARERFGEENVFYFPLDFAFAARAYLRALQPRMLVLLETEFWPRMLVECRRAGVPVVVVNARISDRSWPRYQRLRFLWRPLLSGLSLVLAQSELDVERLRALGAARAELGGNLKYDIRTAKPAAVTAALREHLPPGAKLLICGSTLEGEERMLLDAISSGALPTETVMVLAPRHPERFEAVAQLLSAQDIPWLRRSQWMEAPGPVPAGTIFLLDSIGELASLYALAAVAFVGGSLVSAGGHNPLEPAQFGVPVVMGPSCENFRGIVAKLWEHDAICVTRPEELRQTLARLLEDASFAQSLGARARQVFESEAGATARAADALTALVLKAQPAEAGA
ncbi:3-deoxy-D-manno-octulosonic acid transferase [Paracidobacterium acidisoli]|uniref:3-deoxy-D-manno-octulosonic acid transferase n=1 Tax=Paracidobacterium acidisoli TaxID=2303751 RepID=A0A372IJ12_9BACT|nr:3-deoxy-D-manno-octulosonic acid transferase [Paracidobacterium acidisoli]MBT9333194.1 3-deoxy-D-manno-octulosonic acid transferase [Paracidobacterium acidisoli]